MYLAFHDQAAQLDANCRRIKVERPLPCANRVVRFFRAFHGPRPKLIVKPGSLCIFLARMTNTVQVWVVEPEDDNVDVSGAGRRGCSPLYSQFPRKLMMPLSRQGLF